MQVRILWVHCQERQLKVGDVVDAAAVAEAGYAVSDLIARGEAEAVSPPKKGVK